MKKILPLPIALALLLAGCASSEPSTIADTAPATSPAAEVTPAVEPTQEQPTASTTAPGAASEYAFATGMTFGKVTTSGTPGKELKTFLDGVAESTGEGYKDEVTFWTVKIDNREGTDEAFPNELRAYDKDGGEHIFIRSLDLVEAVQEQLLDAPDAPADSPEWKSYEKMFDMYSAAFEAESYKAKPGAVKEFTILTIDDLPDEIAKMTIDLGGLVGEAEVITLVDAESQGYPLDF